MPDNDDGQPPGDVVIMCSGSITLPPIGGTNDDSGHALAETIRRYVRLHGGNVQAVFGR